MKLGEILVQKGLVDEPTLQQALEAQTIYGGHLGTCLIELGAVSERELGEVLADTIGVRYAGAELFQSIPRYVTQAVPQKVVVKHRVIPFRLENRVLDVAFIDPNDLSAVDEIVFATGFKVEPWIAPEVRIYQAMERYYDVPRKLRYVTLCRQLDSEEIEVESTARASSANSGVAVSSGTAPAPGAAPVAAAVTDEVPAAAEQGAPAGAGADPLRAVSRLMVRAGRRDELLELVVGQIVPPLARAVLLGLKGGRAVIWKAKGLPASQERLGEVAFSITEEPIFSLVRGKDFYHGPLPEDDGCRPFYEQLAVDPPREIFLAPVSVHGRLVGLLYADAGPGAEVGPAADWIFRLTQKLALGLQLVHLKQKILST